MKKLFILIKLLFILNFISAQEVKEAKKQPFIYASLQEATKNAKITTWYKTIKGEKLFVYETNRGSHFYVTKTIGGEFRKQYLKL